MRIVTSVFALFFSVVLPTVARADCIGTSQFETCQDQNGNDYTVNRIGGQTIVNGRNERTGNSWQENSNTIGNQTIINGKSSNGSSWNENETNIGGGNRVINGTDSSGYSFSYLCNKFGCN
ncbi:hypothetical protein [Acetobacter okinawensis]|uniref:hypothetical protein n=1 Tax=Acetobacter okinawensis TaxID=1076594 RepID=UPI0011775164|nr:hypothetical protein [Acetobacter okinawensis]